MTWLARNLQALKAQFGNIVTNDGSWTRANLNPSTLVFNKGDPTIGLVQARGVSDQYSICIAPLNN